MEEFESLTVSELCDFLKEQGISLNTLESFKSNMISGLSLTALDDSELKELIPILGDRASIRNIMTKLKKVLSLYIIIIYMICVYIYK